MIDNESSQVKGVVDRPRSPLPGMFAEMLQDLVDLVWIPVRPWYPPRRRTYVICASRRDQGSACSVAWPGLQTPSRPGWRLLRPVLTGHGVFAGEPPNHRVRGDLR
jgi:hypothetical protein